MFWPLLYCQGQDRSELCWGFSACLPAGAHNSQFWGTERLPQMGALSSDWESDGAAAGGGAVEGLPGCHALAKPSRPLDKPRNVHRQTRSFPASLLLGGASCTHTQFGE